METAQFRAKTAKRQFCENSAFSATLITYEALRFLFSFAGNGRERHFIHQDYPLAT
jgi:hypothetical protein